MTYLQAALATFHAAAERAGVTWPAYLQRLQVEGLLQQGQMQQVALLAACQPGATNASGMAAALAGSSGDAMNGGCEAAPAAGLAAQLVLDAGACAAGAQLTCGSGGSSGAAGPAIEAQVRRLLAAGQALRAARLVRSGRALGVPAGDYLAAAAAAGDGAAFAALYRLFGEARRMHPSVQAAWEHYGRSQ